MAGCVEEYEFHLFNLFQTLYYFDNTTDREPKGIIPLNNVQVRVCQDKSRNYCFELYQQNEGQHMLTIKVWFT